MDDLAHFVLAVFFQRFRSADREVAVLQLQFDLIFLEARKIDQQFIAFVVLFQIRLHHTGCMFSVKLVVNIGLKASERESHPVIKQTLTKNTR